MAKPLVLFLVTFITCCTLNGASWNQAEGLIGDEAAAIEWLAYFNERAMQEYYEATLKAWEFYTNIIDATREAMTAANVKVAAFAKEARTNASVFDMSSFSYDTKRQLTKLKTIGDAAIEDPDKLLELNQVLANMETRYSKGKACIPEGECLSLEPGLTRIMSESRDYGELNWAWKEWRKAVGTSEAKEDYKRYVELKNEAADANGFANNGLYWKSWYEVDDLTEQVENLFKELKPLYNNLHAYVRRKMYDIYGPDYISLKGPIPAHILGNMWSQSWLNILDLVLPFKDAASIDVTEVLKREGYTARRMFNMSDEFFGSLGLKTMPQEFWDESMIEKPVGREVVCHASAWDFSNQIDFRIKQCTDINMDDFITIHHEMGHIEYYLQYKDLPVVYRGGANPGFHEAVGDTLALSVSTPKHLNAVGLLDEVQDDHEADINFLMSMALDKIAFLPFGYLMDKWRWAVFEGTITPENFNAEWWKLRTEYQGIVPPIPRTEDNFDPAAKYHIPSDTPYIRYFVSHILQFQFHKAMCDAAGHTGPLLKCDVYRSQEAGKLLGDMLKLGESREWPDALEAITGTRNMTAQPLVDYFQPLIDWLEQQNVDEELGWDEEWTPKEPPVWPSSAVSAHQTPVLLSLMLALVVFFKP